jgi:hypothetical protein
MAVQNGQKMRVDRMAFGRLIGGKPIDQAEYEMCFPSYEGNAEGRLDLYAAHIFKPDVRAPSPPRAQPDTNIVDRDIYRSVF